ILRRDSTAGLRARGSRPAAAGAWAAVRLSMRPSGSCFMFVAGREAPARPIIESRNRHGQRSPVAAMKALGSERGARRVADTSDRDAIQRPPSAPARVGLIRNPRSHRTRGKPLPRLDGVMAHAPETRVELARTLSGLARQDIDLLVVDGGDGTVRDVLT